MSATVNRLRAEARTRLRALANAPRALARRVYFVPGLTDETGAGAWGDAAEPPDCFRYWAGRCFTNAAARVTWVSFCSDVAGQVPLPYHQFVQFGAELARRIHADLAGTADEVDIVAHSMGGLDAAAAIGLMDTPWDTEGVAPLRGVRNVITYDSPFRGSVNAGSAIFKAIKRLQGRDDGTLVAQAVAMQPDSDLIRTLMAQRDRFLRNVQAFWPRGASDHGGLIEVTHESAAFEAVSDFSSEWRPRYRAYDDFSATEHSGPAGVTRDPRAILEAFRILLGDLP